MKRINLTAVLVIALVLVINLLSNEFHLRLDFTEGKQYTLSKATKDILSDLEEPVTVKAYFSKDLPPNIVKTRKDFQEMLVEFANRAGGMLQYEFINPNEKEATENEALQKGIHPVLIDLREKDQVKQQKAYLGAVVSLGDKEEVIPFIRPGAAMEYALSTAIKKISVKEKPTVGFLQGHGEASLAEMMQLAGQLNVLYNTQELTLSDSTGIPANIRTLVIVRPRDTIRAGDLARLDAFLARGGRLAVALNRVDGDLQNSFGMAVSTGLDTWLKDKGLEVEPNFVADAKCGAVMLQQQTGFFTMQTQVPFPFLPIASRFADHPVTAGLESVIFQFASSIRFSGDSSLRYTPLIFSSEKSVVQPAPQYFDMQRQWTEADLPMNGVVMGAALEGKLSGQAGSKLVVIGDGDFPVNGDPQRSRELNPDNVNLLSNAIDWLSDDTGLIALRTKGVTSRPIRELDEATRGLLKYLNFGLPLLLVVVYGIVRFQRNRIQRLKRMSLNYDEAK